MKYFAIAAGLVIVAIGTVFGIMLITEKDNTEKAGFFGPLHENVRQQTSDQSRAYRDEITRELRNMQFEYIRATPEQKEALSSVILHRTAGIEMDWLSQDLQQFISQLRAERGIGTE
jgi:hypothetical protein